jgi:hypothetical protein
MEYDLLWGLHEKVYMPEGCCYRRDGLANKTYKVKQHYSRISSDSNKFIDVPVCEKCLKEIRTRVAIARVSGNLLFWLVLGILAYIYSRNGNNLCLASLFGYGLLHYWLYNLIFVDTQRPATFDAKDKLRFRNDDFQREFKDKNQKYFTT